MKENKKHNTLSDEELTQVGGGKSVKVNEVLTQVGGASPVFTNSVIPACGITNQKTGNPIEGDLTDMK